MYKCLGVAYTYIGVQVHRCTHIWVYKCMGRGAKVGGGRNPPPPLHVVGLLLLNAAQIVLTPPAPAMGARFYRFGAGRPSGPAGWLALLLLKAGDVETNPGPKHTRTQVWIYDICHREINRKQTSLRCNHSEHWVHLRCAHIRVDQYTDTWICHLHRGSRLPHATHTSPHFPLASSKPVLHSPPTPSHLKHQHTSNSLTSHPLK